MVEGELSPAMWFASDWTCKSAHPFVIDLILVRLLVQQMQTFANFVGGIIRVNADSSAPPVSRRAQRDESADAICRFPFLSRMQDKLNGSTFPGFDPKVGNQKGNVALYRFSTIPCLLTGENWLGILVKQESIPDAP